MQWTKEALKELEAIPEHVRPMALKAVESMASEQGAVQVTGQLALEAKGKYLGMGRNDSRPVKKIAVVRCETVSEVCPGVGCLGAFADRRVAFDGYDQDTQLLAFFTCGGCSGRRVSRLVEKLVKYGVDTVHMSSCMVAGKEHPVCPHRDQIRKLIEAKGVQVVEGTHH
ncbi:MAG: CGGC domain-containing protein [Bacillota bacterium]